MLRHVVDLIHCCVAGERACSCGNLMSSSSALFTRVYINGFPSSSDSNFSDTQKDGTASLFVLDVLPRCDKERSKSSTELVIHEFFTENPSAPLLTYSAYTLYFLLRIQLKELD